MTGRQWGTGMLLVAFLAGALTIGAVAVVTSSFNDDGVSCGAAVSIALHGKQAVPFGSASGLTMQVVTPKNREFLTEPFRGVPGLQSRPVDVVTVCRTPGRGRVLGSVVLLAAAILAVMFVMRRSDRADPTSEESLPIPA